MRVIPKTPNGQIDFLTSHLSAWAADPAAIGLSAAEVAQLQELLDAAREARLAAEQARNAARGATATFNNTVGRMRDAAARAVAKIKATAMGDAGVYEAALILPPAPGSPIPAPGRPYRPRVELLQTGVVRLRWDCRNPGGSTMYEISRSIGVGPGGGREFELIATVGEKAFTDETLPSAAALSGVLYRITAVRSTRRGEPATFVVNFGTGRGVGIGVGVGGRALAA